jgi:hypothetical protein
MAVSGTSWSWPGNTSITSESLSLLVFSSLSSMYGFRVGLNLRRTDGDADGLGKFPRFPKGGLGDPSCFCVSPEVEFRIKNPLGPDSSASLRPSQLGNRCLALRTLSSISCVQLVLPEGDALVAVLTLREEPGES